jgi:hypothetical protein
MLLQSVPNPNYMHGTSGAHTGVAPGNGGNFHNIPYSGDPDFPLSGMPDGLVKGTPEYNAERDRQIIGYQALVNAAEKAYHMKLIVIAAAVAGVAYYAYKKYNNR